MLPGELTTSSGTGGLHRVSKWVDKVLGRYHGGRLAKTACYWIYYRASVNSYGCIKKGTQYKVYVIISVFLNMDIIYPWL